MDASICPQPVIGGVATISYTPINAARVASGKIVLSENTIMDMFPRSDTLNGARRLMNDWKRNDARKNADRQYNAL